MSILIKKNKDFHPTWMEYQIDFKKGASSKDMLLMNKSLIYENDEFLSVKWSYKIPTNPIAYLFMKIRYVGVAIDWLNDDYKGAEIVKAISIDRNQENIFDKDMIPMLYDLFKKTENLKISELKRIRKEIRDMKQDIKL